MYPGYILKWFVCGSNIVLQPNSANPDFLFAKKPRKTSNLIYRGNLGRGGPHRIWGEKGRCLPLHSAPHFSPFLRLLRFILLMIPFLRLILCLHLVSVPPLPHISPSIRLPPCVLTRCVVCLFTRDVNSGMNVRVTVGVTFTASFSLKPPPAYPSLPCTSSGRPSSAPWLCTGNKRSRHALSGLRPWKAMAEAARQAGRVRSKRERRL